MFAHKSAAVDHRNELDKNKKFSRKIVQGLFTLLALPALTAPAPVQPSTQYAK